MSEALLLLAMLCSGYEGAVRLRTVANQALAVCRETVGRCEAERRWYFWASDRVAAAIRAEIRAEFGR